jgi:hypothetical protein
VTDTLPFDPRLDALRQFCDELRGNLVDDDCKDGNWRTSREMAIYWFAKDNHGSKDSNLHEALSASLHRPAKGEHGVDVDGDYVAWELYHAMQDAMEAGNKVAHRA